MSNRFSNIGFVDHRWKDHKSIYSRLFGGISEPARLSGRVFSDSAKRRFGANMIWALRALAKFKALRGSPVDPFGYTAERRMERQLISDYERLVARLTADLTAANHGLAVQLAALPEKIRGFGPIKNTSIQSTKAEEAALLGQWPAGGGLQAVAE